VPADEGPGGGDPEPEPTPPDRTVACSYCGSENTRPVSLFGMGEMTMQYHCDDCHSVFERVKWE
jgi:DNA-directed RNA polymerase subunit RPC12/RpoP